MAFKSGDRFRSKDTGLEGFIEAVSFNSVFQYYEYYVRWDGFPNQTHIYICDQVDTIWEKIPNNTVPILSSGRKPSDLSFEDFRGVADWHAPEYDPTPAETKPNCNSGHTWVDVGFSFSKIVCKYCDLEKKG